MQIKTTRTISPSGLTIITRPDPVPYLYPGACGLVADVCWGCFQPRPDTAITTDRRVAGGKLVHICRACYRTLVAGGTVTLPTGKDLAELLRSWARWDVNGEVDDDSTLRMLAALIPGLSEDDRAMWFLCLQGALLELQELTEYGFEALSLPAEDRDLDALAADAAAKVDECTAALLAGAR